MDFFQLLNRHLGLQLLTAVPFSVNSRLKIGYVFQPVKNPAALAPSHSFEN